MQRLRIQHERTAIDDRTSRSTQSQQHNPHCRANHTSSRDYNFRADDNPGDHLTAHRRTNADRHNGTGHNCRAHHASSRTHNPGTRADS